MLRSYRDSGVIVTFEVQPNMEETVERIGEYSGYSGRFFILTEGTKIFAQPDPLRSDWDFVARFIRGFGDDFYFTGGQIGKRGDGLGGCLGTTYEELSRRDISGRLIEACCFFPGKI